MKKLLTVVLALLVLLSLSTYALAAERVYDFSNGLDGWETGHEATTGQEWGEGGVTVVHDKTFVPSGAAKVTLEKGDTTYTFRLADFSKVNYGDTVTLCVYIPENTQLDGWQIFRQDENYAWANSDWATAKPGEWAKVTWTIPEGQGPFTKFGIQFLAKKAEGSEDRVALTEDEVVYVASEIPTSEEENPQTGYASMLPFVLLAGASGVVLLKSRKK